MTLSMVAHDSTTRHDRQSGMLCFERLITTLPTAGVFIAKAWHQFVLTLPHDISSSHLGKSTSQHWPVVGVVITQKRLM